MDVSRIDEQEISMAADSRIFGSITEVPEGTTFLTRRALSDARVHRPLMSGISGTASDGADSIVVSGGYEDDEDYGDTIIYTGAGGNDSASKRQVADQSPSFTNNAGLATSEREGRPVRVVRGSAGDPLHSPVAGFRYDGLYRVVSHSSKVGLSGFRIWQYRLEKLDRNGLSEIPGVPVPGKAAPKGESAPKHATGVVGRVVRRTPVSDWVKAQYDHQCQICDMVVVVPGGRYAEGAHIRALGRPHDGPDVPGNVLCLCPNCHVRLDMGAVYLRDDLTVVDASSGSVLGHLNVLPTHALDVANLLSHRERFAIQDVD